MLKQQAQTSIPFQPLAPSHPFQAQTSIAQFLAGAKELSVLAERSQHSMAKVTARLGAHQLLRLHVKGLGAALRTREEGRGTSDPTLRS